MKIEDLRCNTKDFLFKLGLRLVFKRLKACNWIYNFQYIWTLGQHIVTFNATKTLVSRVLLAQNFEQDFEKFKAKPRRNLAEWWLELKEQRLTIVLCISYHRRLAWASCMER